MSVGHICKYEEVKYVYMLGKTCERNAKVFTVCVCEFVCVSVYACVCSSMSAG